MRRVAVTCNVADTTTRIAVAEENRPRSSPVPSEGQMDGVAPQEEPSVRKYDSYQCHEQRYGCLRMAISQHDPTKPPQAMRSRCLSSLTARFLSLDVEDQWKRKNVVQRRKCLLECCPRQIRSACLLHPVAVSHCCPTETVKNK